jgi:CRP-like cAMP-binding protein
MLLQLFPMRRRIAPAKFEGHHEAALGLTHALCLNVAILQSCCQSSTSCPSTNCLAYSIAASSLRRIQPHQSFFQLPAFETATVGCEGVVGAMAGLGLYKSLVRVVVQLPVGATKISATQFRKAAAASDAIRSLCVQYNEVLLSQARVTAACNAMHVIEDRFCRWMLQSADRAGSSTVNLTQEFLAEMLGVRRTSITEVARRIQTAGVINYSRGMIKISDRPALERMSCECCQTLLDQSAMISSSRPQLIRSMPI